MVEAVVPPVEQAGEENAAVLLEVKYSNRNCSEDLPVPPAVMILHNEKSRACAVIVRAIFFFVPRYNKS